MRKLLLFVITLIVFINFTRTVFASLNWTEEHPAFFTNNGWTPSAISDNGQSLVVGSQGGGVFVSSDAGQNWTLKNPPGSVDSYESYTWMTLSMSADGRRILAPAYGERVYLSHDGGSSWVETQPLGNSNGNWMTSAISGNGQVMFVGIEDGRLYRTTNGGSTWSETQPAGAADFTWYTTMSSVGQIVLSAAGNGRAYISTNSGVSWSETQPAGNANRPWKTVDMSPDGEVILIGSGERLYLSTNGGDSWSEVQPAGDTNKDWRISSVSSDGQTLFAGNTERLYLSTDGGSSWSETQPAGDTNKQWELGSMSSDGRTFLAGVYDGRLYIVSNPASPESLSIYYPPSSTEPPGCSGAIPETPNLFSIDTAGTYVNLYFSTVSGSTGYNVNYGLTPLANSYGDNFEYSGNLWNIGRTISGLSPNTTYYFRVQAVNGCIAGAWSPVKSVKTKGRSANVSQWFANLNPFSSNPSLITSKSSGQAVAGVSKTPGSCSYVVQEGDSFWRIAEKELGRGSRFGAIQDLNPGVSVLRIGQVISLCK